MEIGNNTYRQCIIALLCLQTLMDFSILMKMMILMIIKLTILHTIVCSMLSPQLSIKMDLVKYFLQFIKTFHNRLKQTDRLHSESKMHDKGRNKASFYSILYHRQFLHRKQIIKMTLVSRSHNLPRVPQVHPREKLTVGFIEFKTNYESHS